MTNPTIEVEIAEILKEIQADQKTMLKEIQSDRKTISDEISNLKIGQSKIEGHIGRLEEKVKNIDDAVKEIKDTQKTLVSDVSDLKGAKSLIIPIVVAVTASILTLVIRAIPIS